LFATWTPAIVSNFNSATQKRTYQNLEDKLLDLFFLVKDSKRDFTIFLGSDVLEFGYNTGNVVVFDSEAHDK
jgi:hypothetical protein